MVVVLVLVLVARKGRAWELNGFTTSTVKCRNISGYTIMHCTCMGCLDVDSRCFTSCHLRTKYGYLHFHVFLHRASILSALFVAQHFRFGCCQIAALEEDKKALELHVSELRNKVSETDPCGASFARRATFQKPKLAHRFQVAQLVAKECAWRLVSAPPHAVQVSGCRGGMHCQSPPTSGVCAVVALPGHDLTETDLLRLDTTAIVLRVRFVRAQVEVIEKGESERRAVDDKKRKEEVDFLKYQGQHLDSFLKQIGGSK